MPLGLHHCASRAANCCLHRRVGASARAGRGACPPGESPTQGDDERGSTAQVRGRPASALRPGVGHGASRGGRCSQAHRSHPVSTSPLSPQPPPAPLSLTPALLALHLLWDLSGSECTLTTLLGWVPGLGKPLGLDLESRPLFRIAIYMGSGPMPTDTRHQAAFPGRKGRVLHCLDSGAFDDSFLSQAKVRGHQTPGLPQMQGPWTGARHRGGGAASGQGGCVSVQMSVSWRQCVSMMRMCVSIACERV